MRKGVLDSADSASSIGILFLAFASLTRLNTISVSRYYFRSRGNDMLCLDLHGMVSFQGVIRGQENK